MLSNFRPVFHLPFSFRKFYIVTIFYGKQLFFSSSWEISSSQHNDIVLSVDSKCPVALLLLDITAAFDTVDHTVLLSCLKYCVGIHGTLLRWFTSYLSNRTFSVMIGDLSSSCASLSCGVPQGSIVSPILFSLYILSSRAFLTFLIQKMYFLHTALEAQPPLGCSWSSYCPSLSGLDQPTNALQWTVRTAKEINSLNLPSLNFKLIQMLPEEGTFSLPQLPQCLFCCFHCIHIIIMLLVLCK